MICKSCGHRISGAVRFCPYCGTNTKTGEKAFLENEEELSVVDHDESGASDLAEQTQIAMAQVKDAFSGSDRQEDKEVQSEKNNIAVKVNPASEEVRTLLEGIYGQDPNEDMKADLCESELLEKAVSDEMQTPEKTPIVEEKIKAEEKLSYTKKREESQPVSIPVASITPSMMPAYYSPYDNTAFYAYMMEKNSQGKAIASLILGILGFFTFFLPMFGLPITIIGLVMGVQGRKESKKSRGMATAGMILSIVFLTLTTLCLAFYAAMIFFGATSGMTVGLGTV